MAKSSKGKDTDRFNRKERLRLHAQRGNRKKKREA